VIYRAVYRWNVEIIEFHFDLEGKGKEFYGGHCWLPDKIGSLIKKINNGFLSDGTGQKKPVKPEIVERDWRTNPKDGLRPLQKIRKIWINKK
jgi:N-acetylneuraminate synthase